MRVRLSGRAQLAVQRIDARWRASADHPEVFLLEMLDAVEHLETVNAPGTPCPSAKHPALKRFLLKKSKCHAYFKIDERRELITILTVWDGRRERSPKL